jgi:hypothetical protein
MHAIQNSLVVVRLRVSTGNPGPRFCLDSLGAHDFENGYFVLELWLIRMQIDAHCATVC